jgi:hypothetical protein
LLQISLISLFSSQLLTFIITEISFLQPFQIEFLISKMGLPMWSDPTHPRIVKVDRIKVYDVIKPGENLRKHRGLANETCEKIDAGLKACKEYFKDPEGVPDETFEATVKFVEEYSESRTQFCNCHLHNFAVRFINAAYQIAMVQSVVFSKDFALTLKDLEDYGDYSPIVAQGLRCEFCFGHHYFNRVNRDTGVQFQWTEIAQALRRAPRSKFFLPPHLHEQLPDINEATPGDVDIKIADSFLEAAKATEADEGAMVWQVVKYADQKRRGGPKDFIQSGRWDDLAYHTHFARIMFDAMWRGPVYLKNRYRDAARTMAIAVALVQCTWFISIKALPEGFSALRSTYEARQYPGPMLLETGESPHAMVSPGVGLFDPVLLHSEDLEGMCEVDSTVPNSSRNIVDERWTGNPDLLEADMASYSLPPHERITQRRIEVLRNIFSVRGNHWRHDLGATGLLALRCPMLHSNNYLMDMVEIAGDPNADGRLLRRLRVTRLPGRGLVSRRGFEGLFIPETIHTDQDRVRATIQRLREFRHEGLESLLDGEPVDESLVLWRNQGASVIFEAMSTRCHFPAIPATETDEVLWTDLCIGLRGATHPRTAAIYTRDLCQRLIELAGSPIEELYEDGWSRHRRNGILPIDLILNSDLDNRYM